MTKKTKILSSIVLLILLGLGIGFLFLNNQTNDTNSGLSETPPTLDLSLLQGNLLTGNAGATSCKSNVPEHTKTQSITSGQEISIKQRNNLIHFDSDITVQNILNRIESKHVIIAHYNSLNNPDSKWSLYPRLGNPETFNEQFKELTLDATIRQNTGFYLISCEDTKAYGLLGDTTGTNSLPPYLTSISNQWILLAKPNNFNQYPGGTIFYQTKDVNSNTPDIFQLTNPENNPYKMIWLKISPTYTLSFIPTNKITYNVSNNDEKNIQFKIVDQSSNAQPLPNTLEFKIEKVGAGNQPTQPNFTFNQSNKTYSFNNTNLTNGIYKLILKTKGNNPTNLQSISFGITNSTVSQNNQNPETPTEPTPQPETGPLPVYTKTTLNNKSIELPTPNEPITKHYKAVQLNQTNNQFNKTVNITFSSPSIFQYCIVQNCDDPSRPDIWNTANENTDNNGNKIYSEELRNFNFNTDKIYITSSGVVSTKLVSDNNTQSYSFWSETDDRFKSRYVFKKNANNFCPDFNWSLIQKNLVYRQYLLIGDTYLIRESDNRVFLQLENPSLTPLVYNAGYTRDFTNWNNVENEDINQNLKWEVRLLTSNESSIQFFAKPILKYVNNRTFELSEITNPDSINFIDLFNWSKNIQSHNFTGRTSTDISNSSGGAINTSGQISRTITGPRLYYSKEENNNWFINNNFYITINLIKTGNISNSEIVDPKTFNALPSGVENPICEWRLPKSNSLTF